MNPGRPPKSRRLKVLQGTLRPDRDREEVLPLPASEVLPEAPEWLPNAHAVREYERLGGVMVANELLTEGNVGLLAVLCAVHGKLVQLFMVGQPTAALVSRYQSIAAELGLTGMARLPKRDAPPENRFATNGRRPDTKP
ncbi:MAG: hypothetical protein U1F54_23050 [Burkholderiales bacterium]